MFSAAKNRWLRAGGAARGALSEVERFSTSPVGWQQAVAPEVNEAERTLWRERLLAYNREDVRATLHVRDWLARDGHRLRPVPGPV